MRPAILLAALCLLTCSPKNASSVGLPVNTKINLVANADYSDDSNATYAANPATLTLNVIQVAGVSIESNILSVRTEKGHDAYVPLKIRNTGNASDSFDLTVESTNGWNASLIYDDNADGIHQESETTVFSFTDMMVPDTGYSACFAKISVPDDAETGDMVLVTAVSSYDGTTAIKPVDIPAPGKQPVEIVADASTGSAQVGQQLTISGSIIPGIQDAIDVSISEPGKTAVTTSVNTAPDGSFSMNFTPSKAGNCIVDFHFAGNDQYGEGSGELTIPVAKGTTSITASASSSDPFLGSTLVVSGSVSPAVQTTLIVEYTDPNNSVTQSQVATDAQGNFQFSKVVDLIGLWSISVQRPESDDYEACSKSMTVTVAEQATPHTVNIASGPTVSPNAITSGSTVACDVIALDSHDHTLTYQWSDGGAGGTFSPSANIKNPTYTPHQNASGSDVTATLACAVSCSQDSVISASGSAQLTVHSEAIVKPRVTLVSPANTITNVSLDSSIVITFSKPMNTAASQAAVAISPALINPGYTWSNSDKTLTITHNGMGGLRDYTCTVGTGACDSNGASMASDYTWTFTTTTAAAFNPSMVCVDTNEQFVTPHIVVTDQSQPSSVSLAISIPAGITVDTTTVNGSLDCVEAGSNVSTFSSQWDSSTRMLTISADIPHTAPAVEVVRAIHLTSPSTSGIKQIMLDGCSSMVVRVGNTVPGDFNDDSLITIKDASMFISEWIRWHAVPLPTFSAIVDSVYDIAPHSDGIWPGWVPAGDRKIDIKDASAFVDSWVQSRSSGGSAGIMASTSYHKNAGICSIASVNTQIVDNTIIVTIENAEPGAFEAQVPLPADVKFDSVVGSDGNLKNVIRGSSIGSTFFSEYDPAARMVNITGDASGHLPYIIGYIKVTN